VIFFRNSFSGGQKPMKRRLTGMLILILSAVAAASFVSGSTAASTIPLLRVGINFNTSTLDPAHSEGVSPFPIFERLLAIGPDFSLHPELAVSWSHPASSTYIFNLRHGVRFSDGTALTASDVANALNYERYPTAQNAGFFGPVRSIVARGRYTVVVTLRHVDAGWIDTLGYVGEIFEQKFQQEHKTTMGQPGVGIITTGAWKVDSFDPTSGAELSPNPYWWGGKVPIQHISFKFFSNEQGIALAFRAGEIDVATPVDVQGFVATSGAKVRTAVAHFNPGFISLNVNNAPWNDVHVRRAVAYAINRTDIIKATGAPGSAMSTFIPPQQLLTLGTPTQVNALLKSLPSYPFNVAKARAEMAKSAYPHGFTSTTDTFQYGAYVNIQQVIAAELAKIGITLKINVIPASAWVTELAGPKGKLGFEFYTDGPLPSPDPNSYPSQLLGTSVFNTAAYNPPAFAAMLSAGIKTQDKAKRLGIYAKVLRQLALDEPYVPLYLADSALALSSKFTWPTWSGYNLGGVMPSDWCAQIKAK
jgi:peptide/nickel transport system substrate-binding protein